jgi:hypothetical protein
MSISEWKIDLWKTDRALTSALYKLFMLQCTLRHIIDADSPQEIFLFFFLSFFLSLFRAEELFLCLKFIGQVKMSAVILITPQSE